LNDNRDRGRPVVLPAILALLAPLVMVFLLAHILWGLAVASLLFPLLPRRASDALVLFWSRVLLAALGIRLELRNDPAQDPPAAARGSLLLINHTSWVDVFVVAAVVPARFVAKSEIAAWPLVGRLVKATGTVFVERGRRHAVAHVNRIVTQRLRAGQSVGIFPEGTTTDGACLLRFHANLVQPALDAPAPVVPLALQYRQYDRPSTAAAFVGDMTLFGSLWRILVAPRLSVRLHWLAPVAGAADTRQAIAQRARAAIAAALALPEAAEGAGAADAQRAMPGEFGSAPVNEA
jgi:1-acyl-sn-glycerol-3-phosphate acyltransferase